MHGVDTLGVRGGVGKRGKEKQQPQQRDQAEEAQHASCRTDMGKLGVDKEGLQTGLAFGEVLEWALTENERILVKYSRGQTMTVEISDLLFLEGGASCTIERGSRAEREKRVPTTSDTTTSGATCKRGAGRGISHFVEGGIVGYQCGEQLLDERNYLGASAGEETQEELQG